MSNWYDHRDTDPYLNRQPTNTEMDRMVERGARAYLPGLSDRRTVPDWAATMARTILVGALGEAEE